MTHLDTADYRDGRKVSFYFGLSASLSITYIVYSSPRSAMSRIGSEQKTGPLTAIPDGDGPVEEPVRGPPGSHQAQ